MIETMKFRKTLRAGDREEVRRLVEATGFFRSGEVEVALELVDENLAKGEEVSGYHFLFAEREGKTLGYLSFGPIPCTLGSFDLYWIVVDPQERGGQGAPEGGGEGDRLPGRTGYLRRDLLSSPLPAYQNLLREVRLPDRRRIPGLLRPRGRKSRLRQVTPSCWTRGVIPLP